jgi:hypothetical protein
VEGRGRPVGPDVIGPTLAQHRRMHALWREAGVTDRADRLALTSRVVGRTVTSSKELTATEASRLTGYMQDLADHGELADLVRRWLAAHGPAAKAVDR